MAIRRKLNLELVINHEPLHLYGERARLITVKGSRESWEHVMMKLVSYVLFYHEDLEVERRIGQHYKPDLVRLDLRGEPVQWIDCGKTTLRKLDRITRSNQGTFIDIVKPSRTAMRHYKRMADEQLALPERVRYWAVDANFLRALAAQLTGRHELVATVAPDGEHLYVSVDGAPALDTRIECAGQPPTPAQHRLDHIDPEPVEAL